jgi:hypothetical protein
MAEDHQLLPQTVSGGWKRPIPRGLHRRLGYLFPSQGSTTCTCIDPSIDPRSSGCCSRSLVCGNLWWGRCAIHGACSPLSSGLPSSTSVWININDFPDADHAYAEAICLLYAIWEAIAILWATAVWTCCFAKFELIRLSWSSAVLSDIPTFCRVRP